LIEGRCELWIASIRAFTEHQTALHGVLSPEERAHVQRVREGQAIARLSRGLLRLVLARHLELAPADVQIDRRCPDCGRPHGRPRLRPDSSAEAIAFSVSHGGDLLVLAFAFAAAAAGPIGVDVEPVGAVEALDADLLDFTLTAAERHRLFEVPAPDRRRVFLRHWTAKEAALKALGVGLDVEPQAVALAPSGPEGRVTVTPPDSSSLDLWVREVDVGAAHVCSLVTGHEVRHLWATRVSPSILGGRP
jgi:4'-phosphopantetheinyl transferase